MENQKIYQNYFFILNFFQKVKFSIPIFYFLYIIEHLY